MNRLAAVPPWMRSYVGIPYREKGRDTRGVDCYGLLWRIYAERLGKLLPRYDEESGYNEQNDKSVNDILTRECVNSPYWVTVPLDKIAFGDLLLFSIRGKPRHVGICLTSDFMLHTLQGHDSAVERWRNKKWQSRLIGAYRRTY